MLKPVVQSTVDTQPGMLKRIAYISDVAAEATSHGSALVYRLFEEYAPDHLKIVESNLLSPSPAKRLKDVEYSTQNICIKRMLTFRFLPARVREWYARSLYFQVKRVRHNLRRSLESFQPEAVVTVAHGYLWIAAAAFAKDQGLPLHLIVHDDWPNMISVPAADRRKFESIFAEVYNSATSRLCVSPYMVSEYRRRYGTVGQVLYPNRSLSQTTYDAPPERLTTGLGARVFAFAGNVFNDNAFLLRELAMRIANRNGRLLVFGPLTSQQAQKSGLNLDNVELKGMIPQRELIERLRAEADVLFVPMSFAPENRMNMQFAFPSKLTDYTAVGLPLLICGPDYCSAVQWARENPGVAEVSENDQLNDLQPAVDRLMSDPAYCKRLAFEALEIGRRYFSYVEAKRSFLEAIARRS